MMRVDLVRALQHRRQLPRRHRARRRDASGDRRVVRLVAKLSIPFVSSRARATHARATRAACAESRAETTDPSRAMNVDTTPMNSIPPIEAFDTTDQTRQVFSRRRKNEIARRPLFIP
jgi:hypothetical protein